MWNRVLIEAIDELGHGRNQVTMERRKNALEKETGTDVVVARDTRGQEEQAYHRSFVSVASCYATALTIVNTISRFNCSTIGQHEQEARASHDRQRAKGSRHSGLGLTERLGRRLVQSIHRRPPKSSGL